jgi:hypothetical protein
MFVIREIVNCKPGKVKPMVEKFKVINAALREQGHKPMRILTDVSGEHYWTLVAEMEVNAIDDFFAMEQKLNKVPEVGKAMADYHDLVVKGRREIYRVEA